MGVLDFLKKKDKVEPAGFTPAIQNPEQLKNELLGKQNDIPPIESIPLPPKPEEPVLKMEEQPVSLTEKNEPKPISEKPEEKISSIEEEPSSSPTEPKKISDIPQPLKPEEKSDLNKEQKTSEEPNEAINEEKSEDFDFSLPNFTEDELNIDGDIKEDEKETSFETREETLTEKAENKTVEKDVQPNISSQTIKITPLIKTGDTNKPLTRYTNVGSCRIIFEKIGANQETLEEAKNRIQSLETSNRYQVQNYKSFHDNLDLVQEKLMNIDELLFER